MSAVPPQVGHSRTSSAGGSSDGGHNTARSPPPPQPLQQPEPRSLSGSHPLQQLGLLSRSGSPQQRRPQLSVTLPPPPPPPQSPLQSPVGPGPLELGLDEMSLSSDGSEVHHLC